VAVAGTFSSLRNRNFRLFFIGQLISNTGNWLTNVALTLFVLHLGGSGLAVGLLTLCQYGPILLLSAWGGAIADRSDKRRVLYLTQGLEMAESAVLAVLAFVGDPPLAALFVTAACGGVMLAFDNPVRRSFVSEMVPPDDLPNAVVLYTTSANVSRIFGPTLAGLLVVTVGYGWCFTADAISYSVVLLGLWLMRSSELRPTPPVARAKGAIRESLRYIASLPNLWIPFATLLMVGSLGNNFNVTLPLLVTRSLHGSDGEFTLVYAVFSVGGVVAGLVVAHRHWVQLRHVAIGAVALGATSLALAAVPSVATAVPLALLVGAAGIFYFTPTTAIVQVEADPTMHGRLLALQAVFLVGTGSIGGLALGALADAAGARAPVVVGGAVCLAAGAWGALMIRRTAGRSGRPNPVRRAPQQAS
jgi:MFS family permease